MSFWAKSKNLAAEAHDKIPRQARDDNVQVRDDNVQARDDNVQARDDNVFDLLLAQWRVEATFSNWDYRLPITPT